jgi:large conductance mechanosensitive channel
MRKLLADFRTFLLQGNLVTVAVAFVIGLAFVALVGAFVSDWITPILGAIFGGNGPFGDLSFTINGSVFRYGHFIDALITFVAIAAAVFFFVVKPYQYYTSRRREEDVPLTLDQELLTEIRDLLRTQAR